MATTINPLDIIDNELARAAAPKASNKAPLFLFLKEGHKALVRPLCTLEQVVVMQKHNKYAEDAAQRVNSICAAEVGKQCAICARVANDKKLTANIFIYLPVYVYNVKDASEQYVTFKEKDEAGNEQEKPVKGMRLLELSSFGTVADILKWLRSFMKDEDNCKITECNFTITQVGAGQTKSFVVMSKPPKPMDERVAAIIPTSDKIRERILEALPPVAVESSTPASKGAVPAAEADDYDF